MMHSIKTEILINISPRETRVAIIENGLLQEVHVERANLRGIVGNVYKAKVVRVLPGMQAAFVDIGLYRAGFLHVSDVMPFRKEEEGTIDFNSSEADVRNWLHEGQELLVQVVKDPLGTKGARLTTHLSVASRYLVYMPDLHHIGVSMRLENEQERTRLQTLMAKILNTQEPRGYIIRTVAEGISDEALAHDMVFLEKLWQSIKEKAGQVQAPGIVYEDLPLVKRSMRDMVNHTVEKVRVDSLPTYENLLEFVKEFVPGVAEKLEFFAGEMPIFEMYGVESELQKALKRKVPLKSGGYLVIDQTEAMTTIDVNTGAYVGNLNLEETIFKTNLEAVQVIGRQLRLRNLGGIIILDFIDMTEEDHKQQLLSALEKVLARDHAKTSISSLSELGLVQMTRKRTQESLAQQLCEICPECEGRGSVKTAQTISYEIFREIVRESKFYDTAQGFLILASDAIIDWMMDEESQALGELETSLGRPIRLKVEPSYIREQYDIVLI
ncbi:MAG: ribonuclease, Rne/Rng family [Gammaproteobacteria bacterium]|jgi:ribonuclease G|nr:ribonuclease, Rne/Rng family [Gammaproteobacteria bacterium]